MPRGHDVITTENKTSQLRRKKANITCSRCHKRHFSSTAERDADANRRLSWRI